jgi:hypothetical protein
MSTYNHQGRLRKSTKQSEAIAGLVDLDIAQTNFEKPATEILGAFLFTKWAGGYRAYSDLLVSDGIRLLFEDTKRSLLQES